MAKKRATERPKKPITKSETWKALDVVDHDLKQALAVAEVHEAEHDVLDTALNFVHAWIAHPRDEKYIGQLHEVLVRNTLVMKYKRQVRDGNALNAFGLAVSTGPVVESGPNKYDSARRFNDGGPRIQPASRGLLRKK